MLPNIDLTRRQTKLIAGPDTTITQIQASTKKEQQGEQKEEDEVFTYS